MMTAVRKGITRYVRYTHRGETSYGTRDGDVIHRLAGDLFSDPQLSGETVAVKDVKLEVPVDPSRVGKVIGLTGQWSNPPKYAPHPRLFAMLPTTLLANDEDVEVPAECHHIHHEGELVVIIGRRTPRFLSVDEAARYVFGVTVGNDIADQTWYREQGGVDAPSRLLSKAPDTWAPLGSEIVSGIDYNDLALEVRLNGQRAIQARTSEMNNSVAETISYLTEYITLEPGDVIFMGTPTPNPALREMKAGDVVEVELEGVGLLRNRLVDAPMPALTFPMPVSKVCEVVSSPIVCYVRYTDTGGTSYGILEGESIRQLDGDLFSHPQPTGKTVRVADVRLEAPIDSGKVQKVIGVNDAYNNPDAAPRTASHPRWFPKLPVAINQHEGVVDLPEHAKDLNAEGGLVIIIGWEGRHIAVDDALDYVFGVTIGNDWSENIWSQERKGVQEPSRLIAKSMDSWACLYTTIVTGLDFSALGIEVRLNGELAAKGRTSSMVNSVPKRIACISHFVTLKPGDVIYTGAVASPNLPGTRRPMQDGDVVEVSIEKIGTLRNRVAAMAARGKSYFLPQEKANLNLRPTGSR